MGINCLCTFVESYVALLLYDSPHAIQHIFLLRIPAGNVHPTLDRDVRVRDTGRDQLTECAQQKGHGWRNSPLLLQHILQLFEDRVLQNRVDH